MTASTLVLRLSRSNPNHHLWNNNGTWFIHYVVYYPDGKKERFRDSLGTKSLAEARRLRDEFFEMRTTSETEAM